MTPEVLQQSRTQRQRNYPEVHSGASLEHTVHQQKQDKAGLTKAKDGHHTHTHVCMQTPSSFLPGELITFASSGWKKILVPIFIPTSEGLGKPGKAYDILRLVLTEKRASRWKQYKATKQWF